MTDMRGEKAPMTDEGDLLASVETLWRHRWTLLALTTLSMAVAAVLSLWVIRPTYEATSLVQVGLGDLNLGSPEAYRSLALSTDVLAGTARIAGVKHRVLESAASVDILPRGNVIRLRVRNKEPEKARTMGDLWYNSLSSHLQRLWAKRLDAQVEVQEASVEGMRRSLDSLLHVSSARSGPIGELVHQVEVPGELFAADGELNRLKSAKMLVDRGELTDITVVTPFRTDPNPVAPRVALNVVAAAFLALVVGTFGVIAFEGRRVTRGAAE